MQHYPDKEQNLRVLHALNTKSDERKICVYCMQSYTTSFPNINPTSKKEYEKKEDEKKDNPWQKAFKKKRNTK